MERKKVLFLTNWYPTKDEPVKAVWIREHAKAVQLYDDVVVLHCVGGDPHLQRRWRMQAEVDAELTDGIPTHRIWYRPSVVPGVSYVVYLWSILRAFEQMVEGGFLPQVVHVHIYDAGWPAIIIGRLNHIPVVVTEHFSSFPRRLLGRRDLWKAWLAFRWADMVLPVSYQLQRAIEAYGIHARFQVVPNVANTALFFPATGIQRNEANSGRILFVGQLVPVRGVSYLLQALARLRQQRRDWHLDIVGDGEARTEYERLAADMKLSDAVTFHGLKTRKEVAQFMRQADFVVVSSLAETFSVPAAEALASGTPVLATRCGGPEEFVSQEVGFLVAPGSADALCTGLRYMLENLGRYSRTRIARYAVERFSPERVGAQLHAVYNSLSCTVK